MGPLNEDGSWDSRVMERFNKYKIEILEMVQDDGTVQVMFDCDQYGRMWDCNEEGERKMKQDLRNWNRRQPPKTLNHLKLGLYKKSNHTPGGRICTAVKGCNKKCDSTNDYHNHLRVEHPDKYQELEEMRANL